MRVRVFASILAEQNIRVAWAKIMAGPDSILVDLISETAEEPKPTEEQIKAFLRDQQGAPLPRSIRPVDRGRPSPQTSPRRSSKARFEVSIADLLAYGLIVPGQQIFRNYRNKRYTLTIDERGNIVFPDGKTFPSLSAAGKGITNSEDRGWTLFFTKTPDGEVVSLHELRLRLLRKGAAARPD
jgi:hypothetical protein